MQNTKDEFKSLAKDYGVLPKEELEKKYGDTMHNLAIYATRLRKKMKGKAEVKKYQYGGALNQAAKELMEEAQKNKKQK